MSTGLEKYSERNELHGIEGHGPFWQFAIVSPACVLYRHCSFCGKVERRVWDENRLEPWETCESES